MGQLSRTEEGRQLSDIMSVLGNDVRLLIFTEAMKKSVKPSEILEKTDITIQALHKQITNLVDSGLVQKFEGKIWLTEFGRNISGQIPTLNFFIKHWEYFDLHSITDLPTRYFQSIGMLRNCEEIHTTVRVLEKTHSIIRDSNVILKMIVAQSSLETAQVVTERLNRGGITLQYIMGENTIIPKGRRSFLKKAGWYEWLESGKVKRRMVKNATLMMVVSETESLISFPDNKHTVHGNSALYSRDAKSHEWCSHLFDDIWNNSYEFDEKKVQEE